MRPDHAAALFGMLRAIDDGQHLNAAGGNINSDTINLDFTKADAWKPDYSYLTEEAVGFAERAVPELESVLEAGAVQEPEWRLLAILYLHLDRADAFAKLAARFEERFDKSVLAQLPRTTQPIAKRIVFDMPPKITQSALPDIIAVMNACRSPGGALVNFATIRGVDAGGLKGLAQFFSQLPRDAKKPELPGVERFIAAIEKNAQSDKSGQEPWRLLFEYQRFCGDESAFDEVAIQFAMRYSISTPSW